MSAGEVRATRRGLLAGSGAVLLAGCAALPTSGPVEQVSPPSQQQETRGVEVRPVPPQADAPADVVLAGFIDAMASLEPGYQVARQYLTPRAAQGWNPLAGVTVFDGDTRAPLHGTGGADTALQAVVVGQLDADGHYAASSGALQRFDFQMRQVDGQWRIGNPPKGLLVSQYTLQHRFSPVQLWFLGQHGSVVPERVWLASSPASPTEAVQALLKGPSPWLAPSVTTALPAGTRLALPAVTVTDGVAEVALGQQAAALPDSQRSQVVAQLGWTLRPFAGIRAVRVMVDGQPWTGLGADSSGAVDLADVEGLSPVPQRAVEQVPAVVKGQVGRLDEQGSFVPLGGVPGAHNLPAAAEVAVHGATVAVVDAARSQVLTLGATTDRAVARLQGKQLHHVQFTASGQLWVAAGGDAAEALHLATENGTARPVVVPQLAGAGLVAFAVSPAESRLAVVLSRGSRRELGLLRLHGSVVDGYRAVPLVLSQAPLAQVVDVGWTTPGQLMVVAAPQAGGRTSAYLVSDDGAQVDQVGPNGDGQVVALATQPQLDGARAELLLRDAQVLRYESAWRWTPLATGVTALGPDS